MDSESKKLLEETFELSKENNKMLRKVRGVQKFQAFWSILKILIVIGLAFGAFYYLEPYLEKATNLFNEISGMKQSIGNGSLEEMLKKL